MTNATRQNSLLLTLIAFALATLAACSGTIDTEDPNMVQLGQSGNQVNQYWIVHDYSTGTPTIYKKTVDGQTFGMTSTAGMTVLAQGGGVPQRMGVAGFKKIPGTNKYMCVVGSTDQGEAQFAVVGEGWKFEGSGPPVDQFWIQQDASGQASVYKRPVNAYTLGETTLAHATKIADAGSSYYPNPAPRMGVSSFKRIPGTSDYIAIVGSTDQREAQFVRIGIGTGGWIFSHPPTGRPVDDLREQALLLSDLNMGAGNLMAQVVSYSLGQNTTEAQKVEDVLQVLNAMDRDQMNAGSLAGCHFGMCPQSAYGFAGSGLAPPDDLRPDFNDGTNNQAYHSYFYVGLAYFGGPNLAKAGNWLHDDVDSSGTEEDSNAADAGIAIGAALRDGISIQQAISNYGLNDLDAILSGSTSPNYTTPVSTANLDAVVRWVFTGEN